jgi:putative hemolysin
MHYLSLLAVAILLTGCGASSPVAPVDKDSYSVNSVEAATAYCAKEGRIAVVKIRTSNSNWSDRDVIKPVIFGCVKPGGPEPVPVNISPRAMPDKSNDRS